MIRVVLADDHRLVREGIAGLLRLAPDVEIVGEASNGEEAVDLATKLEPDVALFDVRMPKLDGLRAFEKMRKAGLATKTILISTFDDDEILKAAIGAGVSGFLLKDVSFDVLADAIRKAAAGERVGSVVTSAVRDKVKRDELEFDASERPEPLTPREADVLRLIAAGMSNREIGDALGLSEGTVKNHTSQILAKLGVRDRTRAVLKAIQRGDL